MSMFTIDIKRYNPGRFAYLMEKPFVRELWDFLTDENSMNLMISATQAAKPAIWPILAELETRFDEHLSSPEYPKEEICVLTNNMIKQIFEMQGFEHMACGLCRQGDILKVRESTGNGSKKKNKRPSIFANRLRQNTIKFMFGIFVTGIGVYITTTSGLFVFK